MAFLVRIGKRTLNSVARQIGSYPSGLPSPGPLTLELGESFPIWRLPTDSIDWKARVRDIAKYTTRWIHQIDLVEYKDGTRSAKLFATAISDADDADASDETARSREVTDVIPVHPSGSRYLRMRDAAIILDRTNRSTAKVRYLAIVSLRVYVFWLEHRSKDTVFFLEKTPAFASLSDDSEHDFREFAEVAAKLMAGQG